MLKSRGKIDPKSDKNQAKNHNKKCADPVSQNIEKMSDPSAITISGGTSRRQLSGPDGRGKGGRGQGKPSPGSEKQEKREVIISLLSV